MFCLEITDIHGSWISIEDDLSKLCQQWIAEGCSLRFRSDEALWAWTQQWVRVKQLTSGNTLYCFCALQMSLIWILCCMNFHQFSWISLPRRQSQFVSCTDYTYQFFEYLIISTQPSFMMWVVLSFIRWEEREEFLSNNWGWHDQLFHCPKCTGSRQWVDGGEGSEGNATEDSDLLWSQNEVVELPMPNPLLVKITSAQWSLDMINDNIDDIEQYA